METVGRGDEDVLVQSGFDWSITIDLLLLVLVVLHGISSFIGSVGRLSKAVCTCYFNPIRCSLRGVCQLGFQGMRGFSPEESHVH
jgi:hypothetical protein